MKNGQKEQLNFEKTPIENNLEKDILRTSINTFQKMKDLQSLIKKESAIKELCKKKLFIIFYSYKNKRRSKVKNR